MKEFDDLTRSGKWCRQNPGYSKLHYAQNQECCKELGREWRVKNPEYINEWMKRKRKSVRTEIFGLLGNRCHICGLRDSRTLEIAHLNNNGAIERRALETPCKSFNYDKYCHVILRKIKGGSKEHILACANCHVIIDGHQKPIFNIGHTMRSTRVLRNKILDMLWRKCAACGTTDIRVLAIDHVNGGGRKERKRFKSYYSYLKHVLDELSVGSKNYQLLCANCNQIKKHENYEVEKGQKIQVLLPIVAKNKCLGKYA